MELSEIDASLAESTLRLYGDYRNLHEVKTDEELFARWTRREIIAALDSLSLEERDQFPKANAVAKRLRGIAEAELALRRSRLESGRIFTPGQQVRVTEELLWWPRSASSMPPVGITGVVQPWEDEPPSSDDPDYFGLVPVRFLSNDIEPGIWEEGDDPDWEYHTINLPNYALERAALVSQDGS